MEQNFFMEEKNFSFIVAEDFISYILRSGFPFESVSIIKSISRPLELR